MQFRDVKSNVHRENRWHNDIHTFNNASRLIILYKKYIQFSTHAQYTCTICILRFTSDDDDQSTGVFYS